MICNSCKTNNNEIDKFCKQCIAPLNIKNYTEFDQKDFIQTITSLLDSVGNLIDYSNHSENKKTNLLRAYLNSFWLRPETAVYCATEANLIQEILKNINNKNFLDLGCGNGVHTSLMNGWEFSSEFDVFEELLINTKDIYNSPLTQHNKVSQIKKGLKINYGIDIKKNMIERANLLGTFKNLICNKADDLPLGNETIGVVYSNVLRDFETELLKKTFKELNRIIEKNGYLIFTVPTQNYKDHLYYYPRSIQYKKNGQSELAENYLDLDRGRSVFCKQQIPISDWKNILEKYNFKIEVTHDFAGKKMMEFWDTGLRPYTSFFLKNLNEISSQNKLNLKIKTVDLFYKILSKIMLEDNKSNSFAFTIIVAKKNV